MKYCKYCGSLIPMDAVICTHCGRQVEELKTSSPQGIVINNTATANPNVNVTSNINQNLYEHNRYTLKPKNKWVAFLLCLFLGVWGVHKFYEGKILLGIVYLFTFGFLGVGIFIDLIILLFKPNPYFI